MVLDLALPTVTYTFALYSATSWYQPFQQTVASATVCTRAPGATVPPPPQRRLPV